MYIDCTLCTWSVDDVAHTEETYRLEILQSFRLYLFNVIANVHLCSSLYTTDVNSQMLVALGKDNGNAGVGVGVMGGNSVGRGVWR